MMLGCFHRLVMTLLTFVYLSIFFQVRQGFPDDAEILKEGKKPAKIFAFSGTLKCLPELEKGLKIIQASRVRLPMPDPDDILRLSTDNYGVVDLSPFCEDSYTDLSLGFQAGEFIAKAEQSCFVAKGGTPSTYPCLTLVKKKSAKAMAASPKESDR